MIITAQRAKSAWFAEFRHGDGTYRVESKKFSGIEPAVRRMCEHSGIALSDVTIRTAYDDAKAGADQAAAEAEAAAKTASVIRRSLVRKMKADGLANDDIAAVIGISHQRVSQLLAS